MKKLSVSSNLVKPTCMCVDDLQTKVAEHLPKKGIDRAKIKVEKTKAILIRTEAE